MINSDFLLINRKNFYSGRENVAIDSSETSSKVARILQINTMTLQEIIRTRSSTNDCFQGTSNKNC